MPTDEDLTGPTIEVTDWKTGDPISKPRFAVLRHGSETSTSKFSYTSHVFFIGVLHRRLPQLTALAYAQTEGERGVLPLEIIRQIERGEWNYAIHQGMSRAQCRFVDGVNDQGQAVAKSTNVYLIHHDTTTKQSIRSVCPGIEWETWESKYIKVKMNPNGLSAEILEWLEKSGLTRITSRDLRIKMGLEKVQDHTLKRALQSIIDDESTGWIRKSRTLVKK